MFKWPLPKIVKILDQHSQSTLAPALYQYFERNDHLHAWSAAVAANIHDPTEENFITVAVFGAVEYSVTNVCASGDVAHTDVPTAGTPFACDER